MADHSGGSDWEHGSDGKWYQPGVLSGAGWWRASDDRWYRPEQHPSTQAYLGFPLPSSAFTFVQQLVYWPEVDADGSAFSFRDAYPMAPSGAACSSHGDYLSTDEVVDRFTFDRRLGLSVWASGVRWEGREVFDLVCTSQAGSRRTALPGSVVGLDLSPDGTLIAVLAWDDGPTLELVDAGTLSPRLRLRLDRDHMSGGEPIRFSGDGRYLLISILSFDTPSLIIDVSTGGVLPLPWLGAASWRTALGPGRLLLAHVDDGATTLDDADLSTGSARPLGRLAFPEALNLQNGEPKAFNFEVANDGIRFLAVAYFGSRAEMGEGAGIGGRTKWVTGRITDGEAGIGAVVESHTPSWNWAGQPALEFHQFDVRWIEQRVDAPIVLSPSLQDSFTSGDLLPIDSSQAPG